MWRMSASTYSCIASVLKCCPLNIIFAFLSFRDSQWLHGWSPLPGATLQPLCQLLWLLVGCKFHSLATYYCIPNSGAGYNDESAYVAVVGC
jgi:hypothetical protein